MKKTFAVLSLAGVAFAAACGDMTTEPIPLAFTPDGAPSFARVAGAGFTTDNPIEDDPRGCLHGNLANPNPAVNCNLYGAKPKVWINGGPRQVGPSALTPGDYFFAIVEPGGQGGGYNPNDDAPKNLSDRNPLGGRSTVGCATGTGCGDDYTNRMFRVGADGDIVQFLGTDHRTSTAFQSTHGLMIAPYYFDDTNNNGGVYILAICRLGNVGGPYTYPVYPSNCKYDAFKVREGTPEESDLAAFIEIESDGVNEVGDPHTFTVTLTAVAGEPAYTFTITPNVPLGISYGSTCGNPTISESGSVATCTITIESSAVGSIEVGAAGTVRDSWSPTQGYVEVSTNGQGLNSGPATKWYVDAHIAISPLSDHNNLGEQHVFTITFTALPGTATPVTFNSITPTVTPPAGFVAADWSMSSTCAAVAGTTTNPASCTVTINSNRAGVFTASATGVVTIGADQDPPGVALTRSTDGSQTPSGAQNSGAASKTYVAGSLSWEKRNQDNGLQGGARFRVCRTDDFVSASNTFASRATPACFEVTDNSAPDTNPQAGRITVAGLVLGLYTVQEIAAPNGFVLDPTIRSTEAPYLSFGAGYPGADDYTHYSFPTAWVNRQIHGCTPGYFKNNGQWPSFLPDFLNWGKTTPVKDVFSSTHFGTNNPSGFRATGNATLDTALGWSGDNSLNGAAQNLLSHATAALLNARHAQLGTLDAKNGVNHYGAYQFTIGGVTYSSVADVIAQTNIALNRNGRTDSQWRSAMLALKDAFDRANNARGGCPLNAM